MQRLLILALIVLVAGCAAPPAKEEIAAPAPPKVAKVDPIDFEIETTARLLGDKEGELQVGDEMGEISKVFPKDKGSGFQEIPPSLDAKRFVAWGWQQKDGSGFGAILDKQSRKLVAAVRTTSNVSQPDLDRLVIRYTGRYGGSNQAKKEQGQGADGIPELSGKSGSYSFWDFDSNGNDKVIQRLMICAVNNKKGGYTVTVAMGDAQVMDALDASEEAADKAMKKAETLFDNQTTTGS